MSKKATAKNSPKAAANVKAAKVNPTPIVETIPEAKKGLFYAYRSADETLKAESVAMAQVNPTCRVGYDKRPEGRIFRDVKIAKLFFRELNAAGKAPVYLDDRGLAASGKVYSDAKAAKAAYDALASVKAAKGKRKAAKASA